ncbi:histidine phosphatase family protein [Lichenihabitans sp. PAMC28606]|uniref:histidine phosphatase family protein n=1 Tax=Lichenihabitans sp. PAMC28606 TaxID=2880932 RepID=UPI001D0A3E0B|nr:histidine phosphatase family protein [Lichenihabitans sp. PAMC28606]UDL94956.1 histidine phosphatase family protein [Lichenihabitans sp. PAMC28606]
MSGSARRERRFLFIRHGETDWNAEGRLQGQKDIPLNQVGQDQAASSGRRALGVVKRDGADLSQCRFVSSPLGRTCETMRLARLAMGLDPDMFDRDERLREFSFGEWEGLTWADVKLRCPDLIRERRRDKWHFVPPDGESYAMLAERVRPWLDTLSNGEIVVSHGGVARALMVLVGGLSTLAAPNIEITQGRVLKFERNSFAWA